jgi:hypothetical protein
MTDENNRPIDNQDELDNFIEDPESPEAIASAQNLPSEPAETGPAQEVPSESVPVAREVPAPPSQPPPPTGTPVDEDMNRRLERLGGEPAPVITPEEFARLQKAGQVNIDARGRVRTARRSDADAGVSLRKRRAWYG